MLGIDPGLRITGYGVIACRPGKTDVVDFGHIKTDPKAPVEYRLQTIHWGIRRALARFQVQEVAIELPFMAINVRSAFAIGEARAAALLAAAEEHVAVFQYAPTQVKQTVAGYGRSGKREMQETVKLLLGLRTVPEPADVADALAIALCHQAFRRMQMLTSRLQ